MIGDRTMAQNAKTQKTAPAAAGKLAPLQTVTAAILAAGKAAASMVAKCKEAAAAAAPQLDASLDIGKRVDAVVLAYGPAFEKAGHNVKAIFKDALVLHAAGQKPVTITKSGVDIHTTAAKALDMGKHDLRAAAKAVRDDAGLGRKSGGGRKPAAKPAAPAAPSAPAVDMMHVDAFFNWLDMLPEYLKDAIYRPKIDARLIEMGFVITKAATGRTVKGKAS